MRVSTCSNSWDDIWAEVDSRDSVRRQLAKPVVMETHATQCSRQAAPKKRFRGCKRAVAVILCAVVAVYMGAPVASAVQVSAAIQRGQAAALANQIDWQSLRPAINAALAAEKQRNDSQLMPAFISAMAEDLAERLSSPAEIATMLGAGPTASGAQPERDMLSRVRILEAGLWEVTLTSPHAADRSVRLTLALTDVARLRWDVQAIDFPIRFR